MDSEFDGSVLGRSRSGTNGRSLRVPVSEGSDRDGVPLVGDVGRVEPGGTAVSSETLLCKQDGNDDVKKIFFLNDVILLT